MVRKAIRLARFSLFIFPKQLIEDEVLAENWKRDAEGPFSIRTWPAMANSSSAGITPRLDSRVLLGLFLACLDPTHCRFLSHSGPEIEFFYTISGIRRASL
jgi:hypothetical protein